MEKGKNITEAVRERYAEGAKKMEPRLCCPVNYDAEFLEVIPKEVIEKDYGCGDPSKHLREGETVLDLGSGTGKICFIASQVVGPEGRVIGVDFNDPMLEIARKHSTEVAEKIGYANVEFRKGKIEDLKHDLENADSPLIESESMDVVVSNCVLNLVEADSKKRLFQEIYRVLKKDGRAVISDIVSEKEVPQSMQEDPDLWSGCISGALEEGAFVQAFREAGFKIVNVLERQEEPWQVIEGIEFRSLTIEAFKGQMTAQKCC